MSAELLRRAAEALRKSVAEAQHSKPWCPESLTWAIRHLDRNVDVEQYMPEPCAEHGNDCGRPGRYDGGYIALMHPTVALALAAWLEEEARREAYNIAEFGFRVVANEGAALARAILREDA